MAKIYITNGPDKGQSFDLEMATISVGRSPDNDLQVNDRSASRKHLLVLTRANKYFIQDLNSKNGTFVNGKRISSGRELEIKEGLPVSLGKTVICLGNASSRHQLDTLNAAGLSRTTVEKAEGFAQDRPMTPQKNMELLYKVSHALMQSLNLNENISEILEKILHYILDLLKRIDRGAFIIVDAETGEITRSIPILKNRSNDAVTYSRSIVDQVMREGKPIIILDTLSSDRTDLSESLETMKIRSVMCVPLISRSKLKGVIYVDSINHPYGFRKEDLSLLTALGIPAAFAIENASIHSP